MKIQPDAVQQAETALEGGDPEGALAALPALLSEYGRLESRYAYLHAEGLPGPDRARPLDEAEGLEGLPSRWQDEADTLRSHGAEGQATTLERCATDLDVALRAFRQEELTLREAAAWSGYSRKRLREMVREGKLPDNRPEGSQGTIYVRRCDLPRKPAGDREAISPADRLYTRLAG